MSEDSLPEAAKKAVDQRFFSRTARTGALIVKHQDLERAPCSRHILDRRIRPSILLSAGFVAAFL